MSEILIWQQEYITYVSRLSNDDLFQDVFDDCHGDSWDGCFTKRGFWKYTWARNELRIRLEDIGFLEKE